MDNIIDTKPICDRLKLNLKNKISRLNSLTIASVSIGKEYSLDVYLKTQKKMAQECGVEYLSIKLDNNVSQETIVKKIDELNHDKKITGIIVNKPFPPKLREEILFSSISPKKDIEGMNPYNLGKLFIGEPIFISPTILSVLELLRTAKLNLYGKDVTIVGFSNIIGKPLALLLGKMFATVTITHIATYERGKLSFYVKNADVLISAVGKPYIIKGSWIKKGAVVIDVGTGEKDGKLTGDVEFESAKKRAGLITTVPGGVGRLTPVYLFHNLLKAKELQ